MKTKDFRPKLSSKQIIENIEKHFGMTVKLESYSREQLEDMRNKLRTKMFQHENSSGINDLLTNETYQKEKAMLALLNTRIKEMLGEDIKKIKDRIDQLSEAKKGTHPPKNKITAKGTKPDFLDMDKDGNKTEPMKQAIKDKKVKEGAKPDFLDLDNDGNKKEPMKKAAKQKKANEAVHKGTYGSDEHSGKPGRSGSGDTLPMTSLHPGHDERAAKFLARQAKGTPVKGKAQSAAQDEKEVSERDEGEPGKNFAKIAAKAGRKYGSKAAGKRVAGRIRADKAKAGTLEEANSIYKRHVRIVNESLLALLRENEEEKAKSITAAGDIVNDYTSWMQRVGQYQTKSMIELADAIRADFGPNEAETFKQAVGPALEATLDVLMQQRETISNAVAVLAGEAAPTAPTMGAEPADMGPPETAEPAAPDEMNAPDMTAAAEPAATGREMRESRVIKKIQESHSIISKLAK